MLFYPIAGFIAIFGILRWSEIIPNKSNIEAFIEGKIKMVLEKLLVQ